MGNMRPIDSAVVKNETYDVLSADTMGGEYIETIGAACQNPDGYTSGSLFLGKDNDVQHLYRATAAIAFGETIILDTNCVYTTVSGELEGKAEESEVTSLNEALTNEVTTRSELGAHNLLPMTLSTIKAANTAGTWSGNAYTYDSVTYTIQTDSNGNVTEIALSGTANGNSHIRLVTDSYVTIDKLGLQLNKPYIISGCPSGGGEATYNFKIDSGGAWAYPKDYGSGAEFTFTNASNTFRPVINVKNGTNVNGLSFYPMVRLASDPSSEYTPYAMTNSELTGQLYKIPWFFASDTTLSNYRTWVQNNWGKIAVYPMCHVHLANSDITLIITPTPDSITYASVMVLSRDWTKAEFGKNSNGTWTWST